MNISTAVGYVLAFVVDPLYGLPKAMNVGVYRLGDYDPSGQIPPGHQLFLGTGEAFNAWRHKFDPNDGGSIPVVIRIRLAGFSFFECIAQLEQNQREEQHIMLADDHKLMAMTGIKEYYDTWKRHMDLLIDKSVQKR